MFSQTVDMVIGCSLILKNAVGVVGLIIAAAICLYPTLKIISLIAVYKLCGALLEPISDKRIVTCMNEIAGVLSMLFITVAGIAIMFFMTIALLVGVGNITIIDVYKRQTLILSPPQMGKTTLIRDLARQLSNGFPGFSGVKVGIVDERSEIAGCYQGIPQNDVGVRTDILDGCPKATGIILSLIHILINLQGVVISTGGGAVTNGTLLDNLLSKGLVIHLEASKETILQRLKGTNNRPMLDHGDLEVRIDELYRARYPEYSKAHYTVKTDGKEVESIVEEIVALIDDRIGLK